MHLEVGKKKEGLKGEIKKKALHADKK